MSPFFKFVSIMTFCIVLLAFGMAWADQGIETLTAGIPIGDYQLQDVKGQQEISVEGFGRNLVPGKPNLPSKIFALAIPPGAQVVDVSFDAGEGILLPGTYQISPVPLPRSIGREDPRVYERELQRYERNRRSAYDSDSAYPAKPAELVQTSGYRKYNLVDVRVNPFAYQPISGRLTYYPDITVHVRCRVGEKDGHGVIDNLPGTEKIARDMILNYDQAQSWYPQTPERNKGLYDFVIITTDALVSYVDTLVAWETGKGRNVNVVTVSWINANYPGGYDTAENMRNFLRDKYPSGEWGIEDVLLVGGYDDVPMRRIAQDIGYGQPRTDYYFAELSQTDADSWDDDGDHNYAENSDPIDFYNEVNVGRIPWTTSSTVQHICEKTVAYEQNTDSGFKKNILLLGAFFWDDDPNPRTDNAVLMEAKVDQPWMSDWTMTRMYESGYSTYPMDYDLTLNNVRSIWGSGTYAFVNWGGHGSPTSAHIYHGTGGAFVNNTSCTYLNDDYPAIIFADACSNSDTDYLNLGQAMMQQGGVVFVGATQVALGCPGWNDPLDGSSQSMDYYFTTSVTSGDYTVGEAHQLALRNMYTYGLWDYVKYEACQWGAMWGNPNLGMTFAASLSISFPDGLPEYMSPGVPDTITVRIAESGDTYVTGSGTMHYRYDGGTYLTQTLTHISGDLYRAILPAAGCSDTPEFYFSAEGVTSGVNYRPTGAPTTVYAAAVGEFTTFVSNNFDSDPGWTTAGQWAFGQPSGGGGEYGGPDPTSGYSGNNVYGYNLSGDYANYLSETHLTSGDFDCTGKYDVHLRFWRWLGVEQPVYDHAYVRVSNNGTAWTTVWENTIEIADVSWVEMDLDISAVADNQSTVYLRWTMGSTDGGWRYCGWNIDDMQLIAFSCVGGPPEAIDDLTATLLEGDIVLKWTEPDNEGGVSGYVIYRSTDSAVAGDSLAGTSDTTYTDTGAAGDSGTNYYYTVKAVAGSGQKSMESNVVGEYDYDTINTPPVK